MVLNFLQTSNPKTNSFSSGRACVEQNIWYVPLLFCEFFETYNLYVIQIHVNDTVQDGFPAYVYHFDPEADDNGRVHPENRCFCKERDIDQCKPKGLLDVRNCYYGFPIALSYPHFLDADKVLFDKVESGLNPDPEKHRSYFIIEPVSYF